MSLLPFFLLALVPLIAAFIGWGELRHRRQEAEAEDDSWEMVSIWDGWPPDFEDYRTK